MARKLGIDASVVRLLLDIAIMCSQLGRYDEARRLAQALVRFRADLPQPRTVIAVSYLWQDRLQECTKELEATLREFPDCQLAKAFLGTAYTQLGRPGGDRLLKQVVEDGRDEWAIRFARLALGFDYRGTPRPTAAPARTARPIAG